MPISVLDAGTFFQETATTNTSTLAAYTLTAGGNRLMVVGTLRVNNLSNVAVSGVTYGGVSMHSTGNALSVADGQGNFVDIDLWYLADSELPSAAAHDVVATYGTANSTRFITAVVYQGARQSGIPDSGGNHTALGGTSFSINDTTVADNCWLGALIDNHQLAQSAGGGTTNRSGAGGGSDYFDSNAAKTPPGTYSLTATTASSPAFWDAVIAAFAPEEPMGQAAL